VNALALVLLAALVGVIAGVAVTVMSWTTQRLNELLFAIPHAAYLSASTGLEPWRLFVVPILGGLVLGAVMSASGRFRARQVVDPVEANALYGGRMSLLDSLGRGPGDHDLERGRGFGRARGRLTAKWDRGPPRRLESMPACAATTCACSLAAAPPVPSVLPSPPRSLAPSTPSSW